jgi:hypothetical protein
MKPWGLTIALMCGVLSACGVAQSQIDRPTEKLASTSQSSNLKGTRLTHDALGDRLSSPLQFLPLAPCRVVDTRNGQPIQGGTYQTFQISGGVCNVPSDAGAFSLNVSVIPHGSLRYLTVWPAGEPQPVTTTMNSLDGRVKANAAIVPAGTSEAVSVYASDTSDVILDINGYFPAASSSTLAFYPLTPCRVADTRKPNGPLGGPYLQGGVERDFPVLLATQCNIPSSAVAYSFNVAVVPRMGDPLGYLTVWATGQQQPTIATLTNLTGTIVSNAAIVPAGVNTEISVFPSDDTDFVLDINGYFAPPGSGGLSLYPIAPCRAYDSRHVFVVFTGLLRIPVLGAPGDPCDLPVSAKVLVFNATVFPRGALNYLTLWQDGKPQPLAWTLNAVDGDITSNMAIVAARNGSVFTVDAYADGFTQLVLDVSSYFAP